MSECFPPVPLYIVAGMIVAMFTTVMSNVEASGPHGRGDSAFAMFLLILLAVPIGQLLIVLDRTLTSGQCGGASLNSEDRWLLWAHWFTVYPLLWGLVLWFLTRSWRRLRFQRPSQGTAE